MTRQTALVRKSRRRRRKTWCAGPGQCANPVGRCCQPTWRRRVCGTCFTDRAARITHALSHMGILLFSSDMCGLQFCSQAKLACHRHWAGTGTTQPQHSSTIWRPGGELCCAVRSKPITKDFKAVREHLLAHVCVQSLRCGGCQQPQSSLCALLWHALSHLSIPLYPCPCSACSFLKRHLQERHLPLHSGDGGGGADGGEADGGGSEELRCFLCPQAFSSASTFQHHLSQHAGTLQGRQGKCRVEEPPELASLSPLDTGRSGHPGMGTGTSQRAKWYRCRYCGKPFAHLGEFMYHLCIHTGEKPYQCKVCLRFFCSRSTKICHLKTHAGALMYRCTVCGLSFSMLKLVSAHMELHRDCVLPDFNIEQTFMYNNHSKEPLPSLDS
ncbi:hypothetical protein MATL_G00069230 [Megalops atlanticus]|uniref:C2H2-type domain-containing protein n=1 Tax=Megalops atlanticus TaxID=7932 RepID=A0A9D3TEK8_MEGAT|nr:hypothetical protein MATL_G00069230 [Megalops atlanticus]